MSEVILKDQADLARIQRISQDVGNLENMLNADKYETMQESEFVTQYLLTLHQWLRNDPKEEKVNIGIWLDKAKITPLQEVMIVNERGEELYKVPSIVQQTDQVLPREVLERLGEYAHRANDLDKHFPGRGTAFLNENVTKKVIPHSQVERQQRWDAIFERYNLPKIFNVGSPVEAITHSNDIEEFDDFEIP